MKDAILRGASSGSQGTPASMGDGAAMAMISGSSG
jgi:hypothetical protein